MAPHVCTPEACGEFWKMWAQTVAAMELTEVPDKECDCNQEEVCAVCAGWRG